MKKRNDKIRVLASIGFNLVAKLPSLLSLLIILPLINTSLGTQTYGEFLAMLALGSALTLPFGGINTVARRRLSATHGAGEVASESVVVCDVIGCALISTLIAGTIVLLLALQTASSPTLAAVALLPVTAAFFNTFDNLRAAYNEHYVTAILQTLTQFVIYGCAIYYRPPPNAVLISGLTLQLPFILASALTFGALLREKPELRRVHFPRGIWTIFKSAAYVTLSDGAIFAALNASVYGLGATGAIGVTAWYGTLARVFQTLLSPVLLIMLPLTSFVALRWPSWNSSMHRRVVRLTFALSIIYGSTVALIFVFGSDFYLAHLFPAIPHSKLFDLCLLASFFGAIVAQKIYSQLIYSISEGRLLSLGIFVAVCLGLIAASIAYYAQKDPMLAVSCLASVTSIFLLASIAIDQLLRNINAASSNQIRECAAHATGRARPAKAGQI